MSARASRGADDDVESEGVGGIADNGFGEVAHTIGFETGRLFTSECTAEFGHPQSIPNRASLALRCVSRLEQDCLSRGS
jgi:hypothetical protein